MAGPIQGGQAYGESQWDPYSHVKPPYEQIKWFNDTTWDEEYGFPQAFSFVDVKATIVLPFIPKPGVSQVCSLPGLTLLSTSEHRDVYPVVSLGRRGIKNYTTGHRTTAGTLGFTLTGQSPFAEAISKYCAWKNGLGTVTLTSIDELPPFDISLHFITERGAEFGASVVLRGVKILDRSQNISIRDIQLNEAYSFMAVNSSYMIIKPPTDRAPILTYWTESKATVNSYFKSSQATLNNG